MKEAVPSLCSITWPKFSFLDVSQLAACLMWVVKTAIIQLKYIDLSCL